MAYLPTGKGIYTNTPVSFTPDSYDGLVAWYDSNSAIYNGSGIMTSWSDKTLYANHLYPSTNCNVSNYIFNGSYLRNSRTVEFKYPNAGATLFAVWKPTTVNPANPNLTQNIISMFEDFMPYPSVSGSNFSVGIVADAVGSQFYIGTSDLSTNTSNSYNYINNTLAFSNVNIINAVCFTSNYGLNGGYPFLTLNSYSRGYFNGTCTSSSSIPITLTNSISNFNIFVGDSNYTNTNTGNHGGSSYLYEILIYNSVLSAGQINTINQYLSVKYNTPTPCNFAY